MKISAWQQCWRERRSDAAAILCIILFFSAFFAWLVLRGQMVIGGDAFAYSYPLRAVAWDMIKRGQLPLWTPYVMSGYPLLSMSQLGIAYPLTWFYLFLPAHWAEQIYVLAPFLLAPAFTYAYAREIGSSRMGALLAGLSYGYGGAMTNILGVVGYHPHAMMWLPLVLVGLERARRNRFLAGLVGASCAYALSVLTGDGQAFLSIGLVALAYGAALALEPPIGAWWARWRSLAAALGAVIFGAGVGAFQILETMRAARRSIRDTLDYLSFTAGSFSPAVALKSLVAPLYVDRFADVTAYVSPLVCALAVVAVVTAARRGMRIERVRVGFWLLLVVVSGLFMLGDYLPGFRVLYYLPLINRFRVPSRHAFEFTFGLSVLSAFGWDALFQFIARCKRAGKISESKAIVPCLLALVIGAFVGFIWWRATVNARGPVAMLRDPSAPKWWYVGLSIRSYLYWKVALTASVLFALWQASRLIDRHWRRWLLGSTIALICFIEPFILVTNWWAEFAKTPARITTAAPLTHYLQTFSPLQNRVYTRFNLFEDQTTSLPRVDSPNLTALYGLHNVAGYEPLFLKRYSRALGDVRLDGVNALPGYPPNDTLLAANSHVLDLLNATLIVSYSDLSTTRAVPVTRDEITFDLTEAGIEIKPRSTLPVALTDSAADAIAVITSLANASDVEQGETVARVRVLTTDGERIERDLRAGIDTADWSHERPDLKSAMRHNLATVFDRLAGDAANTYQSCRYLARVSLGKRVRVKQVELINLSTHSPLGFWAASLFDSTTGAVLPLSHKLLYLQQDPQRWQLEPRPDGLLVLHNARACPRAWLVTEAEAVDGEEALRKIRGESQMTFDPRRTALLEVKPEELPALPGGSAASNGQARIISYEPNLLLIGTDAPAQTVLVVSELFYPGWAATIDGHAAQINLADYLLRSVTVPAGRHTIEMRYRAPAARNGAVISGFTLVCLGVLAAYSHRKSKVVQGRSRRKDNLGA